MRLVDKYGHSVFADALKGGKAGLGDGENLVHRDGQTSLGECVKELAHHFGLAFVLVHFLHFLAFASVYLRGMGVVACGDEYGIDGAVAEDVVDVGSCAAEVEFFGNAFGCRSRVGHHCYARCTLHGVVHFALGL